MLELVRDVASGPFRFAEEDGIIPVNPVRGVLRKLGFRRKKISSGNPLNRKEVRRFLTTCQESFPDYHPFFLVAFRTGMRMGELLALHWDDVMWDKGVIRVERTFRRGKIGKPKNGRSRYTDMSGQVVKTLRKLHRHRKDDEQIIFSRKGTYISQNSIRRIFKKILREAGLKDIRFHDIRHTFASILASEGISMFYLKEQMGHWSVQMTDEIYSHLLPSGKKKAVNKLDD
jgi:integrase